MRSRTRDTAPVGSVNGTCTPVYGQRLIACPCSQIGCPRAATGSGSSTGGPTTSTWFSSTVLCTKGTGTTSAGMGTRPMVCSIMRSSSSTNPAMIRSYCFCLRILRTTRQQSSRQQSVTKGCRISSHYPTTSVAGGPPRPERCTATIWR